MGRNYTEIQEQWQYITHELKADIRVIDMPMLDTSKNTDNLDRRFIADLVLQILSYTAQKERENIHKRQEMGIAAAQSKGVKFGRPKAQYPAEWKVTYKAWKDGQITATAAMEKMGIKRTTFYKLVKRYEQKEDWKTEFPNFENLFCEKCHTAANQTHRRKYLNDISLDGLVG